MKKETLLEKAKKIQTNRQQKIKITDEHIELAFGWLRDEITSKQINVVLDREKNSGNVLYLIAIWLREAYEQGRIKIK